jgi:membrane-bound acyltransferase YfiQ involved in biofilm formation
MSWPTVQTYLFASPGAAFHYYVPFIVAITAAIIFVGDHYLLEARRRFRNYRPVQQFLDRVAVWASSLTAVAAVLLLVRHGDVPVLSWRIWLCLYVAVCTVVFFGLLFRLYGRLPRQLAAHDNDLLKRRYLPPANQRQVANAPGRRSAARR